jgi:tetratricopeptide (TPR) repeat protein
VLRLPPPEADYGSALERSARTLRERQAALDRERSDAAALVPELLRQRPERWRLLVRNNARFHTWGVLEKLLEQSREGLLTQGVDSERLAELALEQSAHLDTAYYGLTRIEDMRSRAWTTIAEVKRLRSDFDGAEEAFAAAREHLRDGTGDFLEMAILFEGEAALRRCQRRFAEARELLLQALATFVENGEDQRIGLALVSLATVYREAGAPARAIALLREAQRRIDGEREPRLLLSALHHLADSLAAAGRLMEARGVLIRARPLYRRFPDGWTQSHLRWLRGRIALGCGQMAEAEAELLGARAGFQALGARLDAALVALELAPLYVRQERTAELKTAAVDAAGVFAACRLRCELRAALLFHRDAEEIEGSRRELARAAGEMV